ncbi:HET domain-containing protein, partial [Candidatus Bathyarchaeota archaeon]|nr:HET domain-containing protein [Candidatus Bathyarchaeota archaeon]
GQTVMHGAAAQGRYECLREYAARGGDPDIRDENGRTPLHNAAENGFEQCVELLCEMGALRGAKDNAGQSPKDLAAAVGHESTVRVLQDWEARPDPKTPSVSRDDDGAEKRVWIDAICINQNDVDEKSAQVSMMDLIYTRATFVIAWLGLEDAHTTAGVKALNTLSTHLERFQESKIEPFSGADKKNYEAAGIPLISLGGWDGLASIYQRQWFRRSWIAQEAVLPYTLLAYCGAHALSIDDLGVVARALRVVEARCKTSGSKSFTPLDEIAVSVEWNMAEVYKWREKMYGTRMQTSGEGRRRYREEFTLGRLVGDFRTFLSSDPRDKIFSLGGILNSFTGERPGADYRRDVASVYTGAARRIIREEGDLYILGSRAGDGGLEGLPSWVPDFAVLGVMAIPEFAADGEAAFCGLGDEVTDSPVLGVKGIFVGPITEAGGRVSTAPGGKLMFDPSWLRLALSLRDAYAREEEKPVLTEMLWRTLCMNTAPGAFSHPEIFKKDAPEEMGAQFRIFMALMILSGADQKMLESVGLRADQEREVNTTIHEPTCDPWKDLEETLGHLDALCEHDGDKCLTPSRERVLFFWDHLIYTLMRTCAVRDDGPLDFKVTPEEKDGTDRILGRGVVNQDAPVYQKCRDFGAAYLTAYGGRQLVTVGGRFLGLAPVGAKGGDEVWVVPGLRAPAVLRRVDEVGGDMADRLEGMVLEEGVPRYEFVGVSYVHGIMDGEAIRGKEDELQDIALV